MYVITLLTLRYIFFLIKIEYTKYCFVLVKNVLTFLWQRYAGCVMWQYLLSGLLPTSNLMNSSRVGRCRDGGYWLSANLIIKLFIIQHWLIYCDFDLRCWIQSLETVQTAMTEAHQRASTVTPLMALYILPAKHTIFQRECKRLSTEFLCFVLLLIETLRLRRGVNHKYRRHDTLSGSTYISSHVINQSTCYNEKTDPVSVKVI